MKLTKRVVDTLHPGEREMTVWDSEMRGFGCRVHPSGRRTFIFKYRVGGGRGAVQRKMLLGAYGAITVDQARAMALQAQAEVARGGDPAGARADRRHATTVRDYADRYSAEHAALKKGVRSAREDKRLIDRHIVPKLGIRKVADLTTTDVARLIHGLAATPILANRVRSLLSKMLSLATIWGLRSDPVNPVSLVQKFPEHSRERYLSVDELKRLGEALVEVEREGTEQWQAIAAIRLLLFTGCRKSEILFLRWEHIHYDHSVILLPESKTGRKTIYLTAPVLEVLATIPRKQDCPFVLPSCRGEADHHFGGLPHAWERIRTRAKLSEVRLHDLRHTFASKGVGMGLGLPIIGGLLGHTLPTTTAKYAHLAANPTRDAGERIAGRLRLELSGRQATTIEPVPLSIRHA